MLETREVFKVSAECRECVVYQMVM